MMMFWALLYINSLYLDGLEMLTRRISSCGVTKRKGLRWLTVILSLIFTCSWSYAGTLCELVTFQTRFQLHYRQKNGCQNKIGVLLLLYLLFMFFFLLLLTDVATSGNAPPNPGMGWMGSRKRLPSHHKQAMRSGSHQDAWSNPSTGYPFTNQ
jgi:hypothetical protein